MIKGSWQSCAECERTAQTVVVSGDDRVFLCAQCFELKTGSPLYEVKTVIHRPKKHVKLTCTACQREYSPKHNNQKYCCGKCRKNAADENKKNKAALKRMALNRVISPI